MLCGNAPNLLSRNERPATDIPGKPLQRHLEFRRRRLDELYGRLLGFEPKAVACAVRCLIVADDEDQISALSARILDDGNISAADQLAWREAVEKALSAHIAAGTMRRDERTASQIAGDAVLGKPVSPC